jgi:hypothetical protein
MALDFIVSVHLSTEPDELNKALYDLGHTFIQCADDAHFAAEQTKTLNAYIVEKGLVIRSPNLLADVVNAPEQFLLYKQEAKQFVDNWQLTTQLNPEQRLAVLETLVDAPLTPPRDLQLKARSIIAVVQGTPQLRDYFTSETEERSIAGVKYFANPSCIQMGDTITPIRLNSTDAVTYFTALINEYKQSR